MARRSSGSDAKLKSIMERDGLAGLYGIHRARGRAWLAHIERGSAVGSGIVAVSDGYVVTNEHVVHEAGPIRVGLSDGRTLYGELVGTDPTVDLAVIHVPAEGLHSATFGSPDHLQPGDPGRT